MAVPPGLIVFKDFISQLEENRLVKELRSQSVLDKGHLRFSNTAQQEYGPRISDAMELITDEQALAFPTRCQSLLACVAKQTSKQEIAGADAFGEHGVFLRINHYSCPTGGYMHKHLDSKRCFGPIIACCSLLSDVTMTFYDTRGNSFGLAKVHQVRRVHIPRRSLYLMTGASRTEWQHGILKEDCPGERFSLTFRTVCSDAPTTTAKVSARAIGDRKQHNVASAKAPRKRPAGDPLSNRNSCQLDHAEPRTLARRPAAHSAKKARVN